MLIERRTDWEVRRATAADDDSVAEFLGAKCWAPTAHARELYTLRYRAPGLAESVGMIATNSCSQIVATSMFQPWTLSTLGKSVAAYQWSDLFVDVEYRGQAIPDLTLQQGLVHTQSLGSQICFAFPLNQAVAVHKKIGGFHLGAIVRLARPIGVDYLLKRRLSDGAAWVLSCVLNPLLSLISRERYRSTGRVEEISSCGAEFDDLWRRFSDANPNVIGTQKDRNYLNWKYLDAPDRSRYLFAVRNGNAVDGFIVLESGEDIGYIIDLMAVSDRALEELIAFSIKYFKRRKKQSVVFVALEGHVYTDVLEAFWFVRRSDQRHLYLYLTGDLANDERFRKSSNWCMTIGDSHAEHL